MWEQSLPGPCQLLQLKYFGVSSTLKGYVNKAIASKTPSVYVAENLVPDYSHSSLNLSPLCDFDGINFSLALLRSNRNLIEQRDGLINLDHHCHRAHVNSKEMY